MRNLTFVALLIGSMALVPGCKPKEPVKSTQTTATVNRLPVLSPQDNKRIIAREISTWEFGKTRNLPALRQILADDYVGMFGKNVMGPNDILKTFERSTVRSYRMYNIRVKPVSDDVAIIYYNLMQDIIDENGDPWIPNVAASAVYVKRNNNWYSTFYHETPLQ